MPIEEATSTVNNEERGATEGASVSSHSSSLARSMVILGLGTAAVTGLTLVVTRIYADRYGAADLSAILIFRLYGSVLLGVFGLGMPIALQRNVAFLEVTPRRAATVALVGLAIGTASFGLACLVSSLFSSNIAAFLHNPAAAPIWRAFMALAFAQALGSMISLVQIARKRWVEASVVSAGTMGVAPLFSLLALPHASLNSVLYWAAAAACIFLLPSLVEICRWASIPRIGEIQQEMDLLLRYGLPRALGNAAEPVLDLMLPWLALLSGAGLVGAGTLAIGLMLLRPLNPVTGVMSLVLTPSAANLAASGDSEAQATQSHRIAEWALHTGLFATVQLVVWADVLVVLWLGPSYKTAVWPVRIICLSLAPSFFYASIRGIIDGENEQPVNTINLLLSMGVLLVSAAAARFFRIGDSALAVSYFVSRIALGALSLRYVIRTHAADLTKFRLGTALALSVFLGLLAVCVRSSLPASYSVAELVLLGPLSFLAFVAGMGLRGTEWARGVILRVRAAL
jgi:O-antigen/teichoic acid export membrane protein